MPVILGQSLLFIMIALLIEYYFPLSEDIQKKIFATGFHFPLFKYEVLITKFFDISFQQVMIFVILKKLKNQNLSDFLVIRYFTVAFFIIHLPLILFFKLFSFYFIIPSLFAGVIFSYLMLKYSYGLAMSFFVHYLFYFSVGIALRSY